MKDDNEGTEANNENKEYKTLQKKIHKIDQVLEELKSRGQTYETSKEYRAYKRKQIKYKSELNQNRTYKQRKLELALESLHSVVLTDDSGDDNSSSSSSSSSSSYSSSSSSSEAEGKEAEPAIDRPLIQKKYNKVTQLLEDLVSKRGLEDASKTKEYKIYSKKQQQYYHTLAHNNPEWVREDHIQKARRKAEAEAAKDLREQELAVEAAREAAQSELEQAKEAARAQIRAQTSQRRRQEEAYEQAYQLAKQVEDNAARREIQQLNDETSKREEEFQKSLQIQEKLGMIKIGKNASA